MTKMMIVSVPQPYAGYVVSGAIDLLVMPRQVFNKCPLVIVSDSRKTVDQAGTPPGLYSVNIVPQLSELANHALGVVDMLSSVQPDETETGIPYMRGKCYLKVGNPRIYREPFPYRPTSAMKITPISFPDLWPDEELVDRDTWRELHPDTTKPKSGPTTPSRDGWTGD